MDWYQVVQIVQSVLVTVGGIFAWFWGQRRKAERELLGRQRKAERELLELTLKRINERQAEHAENCNRRVDDVNEKLSSKLMPCIQALIARMDRMPEELRAKFLPLDLAKELIEESRRDRAAIWAEFEKRGNRRGPRGD